MKYKSIYFVTTESIKNLGNFRNYLIENTDYLVTFHFPHGYLKKASYMEIYKKGKISQRKEFYKYPGKTNMVKLGLYYLYFNYIVFKYVKKESFIIVENPIFCILNSIATLTKRLKFIFWVGDYFPQHAGFMWFYNKIADFYNKNLKYVLYVSPPLYKHYMPVLLEKDKKTKYRAVFTLGVKKRYNAKKTFNKLSKKIVLGFIGVIRKKQGLELAFEYLSKSSNVGLEIIGDGYSLGYYIDLAKKLNIEHRIKFYGFVEDIDPIIKKWDIGLALYKDSKDNVSKYCEPVKIKDYLEYGLPVITTKTTYMSEEIKKFKAGEVIDETVESLQKAVEKINRNYKDYKSGVDNIVKKYEYKKWYDNEFKFLTEN